MESSHLTPQRTGSIRLRDGRKLAWHEWGAASGYPVIFCTGAGMPGSLGFGATSLAALRLRLIAIDRPGLGGSDPHPGKDFSTWREDVAELLAEQKIAVRPLAVGFSQGAPFALALASAGMLEAVCIVSGQDDFSKAEARSRLPAQAAEFVQRVQSRDRAFLDDLARIATADGFFDLIVSMSSARDRAIYESEPFRSAYHRCLSEGFRSGPAGYIGDLVNALGSWPFEVERIAVPVDFWYGELDANPTHSPGFGSALSKRVPRHSHAVLKDEGGSLLWTRSGEILEKLAGHLKR